MMTSRVSFEDVPRQSPSHRPLQQRVNLPGDIIVIIKAYFDGTGKPQERAMGLAGIAARMSAWNVFEPAWKAVLERYAIPALHMTDLNAAQGLYKGWSFQHRRSLLSDLLGVLYLLLRTPQTCPRMTLIPTTDYKKALEDYPGMIPSRSCLCIFWCLSQMCRSYPLEDHFEIVFDRNESFFHQVKTHWDKKRHANNHRILSRIDSLDLGTTETLLPLQAADLFAWELQRLWQPFYDENYRFNRGFGTLEAESLLLSTHNKRWTYEDLEYLAHCRTSPDHMRQEEVAWCDLCGGCRAQTKRGPGD